MKPWQYKGEDFNRDYSTILLNHWFGFVYEITHKPTGKAYIGKRGFHSFRKSRKVESGWQHYHSSSKPLMHDIISFGSDNFTREILGLYTTPQEVDYREVQAMFDRDVLYAKFPDGTPKYYNEVIPAVLAKRQR